MPIAAPVQESYTELSPTRTLVSRMNTTQPSPVRETIIQNTGYGQMTTSYNSAHRTATFVNDVDVKSRVDMMLEHTRARLGTERVIPPHEAAFKQSIL